MIVAATMLVWNWGATSAALRERAYPIPTTECEKTKTCDEKALQVQAREATAAETSTKIALGQLALSILGLGGVGFTVYYARLAWKAADDTLEATRVSEQRQLRAYVHVEWARLKFVHNRAVIAIKVTNTGQTPAKWFEVAAVHNIVPRGYDDFTVPRIASGKVWSSLAGGSFRTVGVHPDPIILTQDLRPDNSVFLLMRGRVRYADIFDEVWETEFLYFRFADMGPEDDDPAEPGKMVQPNARLRAYEKVGRNGGAQNS